MDEPPRLGVALPTYAPSAPDGWQQVFDAARAADAAGVDRLVVAEHVVFGENLENYGRPELGGMAAGRQPNGPDGHWLEPLTVLAAVAAVTTRVRLTTTILLAALRRPVTLAKTTATLDVLSGGRLDLGVGVGWQREEYEAAGLDFDRRGELLDESLAVLQTLWRDTPASHRSRTLAFERIHMQPKPLQPNGVPVWVAGTPHRRALERIVRYGSGWIPWGPFLKDPAPGIKIVRQALAAAGRDPDDFRVLGSLAPVRGSDDVVDLDATFARVPELVEAGVTDFRITLPLPHGQEAMTEHLTTVLERFRRAGGRS
jgi:probable F420-dependent oxidoreductase